MKVLISFTTILICGLSAIIVGALLAMSLGRYEVYTRREYMPPRPAVDSVRFTAIESTSSSQVNARHFRFATKQPEDSKPIEAVAALFEPQLAAEGWEKLTANSSGNLCISSWGNKNKMGGGLRLVFSIIQLDVRGEYFGTMEAIPYWSY